MGPKAAPGGGADFRTLNLDGESVGAKDRHLESKTTITQIGSRQNEKKFTKN